MKDAYYFQHDANARHDPKLLMLRKVHGIAGIGRWWVLVEILREQEDYHFDIGQKHNLRALQFELDFTSEEELETYLKDLNEFSLIVRIEGVIFSPALIRRMSRLDEIRSKRSEAGKKGRAAQLGQSPDNRQASPSTAWQSPQNSGHLPTYLSTDSRSESSTNQQTNTSTYSPTEIPPAAAVSPFAKTSTTKPQFPQHLQTAANAATKVAPERYAQSGLGELLKEPDTDNIYIYAIAFEQLPAGQYFVPSDPDYNAQKVYLKLSNSEVMTVKERCTYPVSEPSHIVFASSDFTQAHNIIQ